MIWIILLLAAALAAVITLLIAQRRQMQDICRQLAFLEEKDSNLEITLRLHTKSFVRLQERLNTLLRSQRSIMRESLIKEMRFKESIADLSHDIRTPLTSLDGYFQMLQITESPQKRQKYYEVIANRIAVLRELLEELFAYARLQDTNDKLDCEVLPVNAVLTHTLLSFYQEFRGCGVEPEIVIPETDIRAYCNESALRRVVQNVLKNALMHGYQANPRLCISLEKLQGEVCIQIANRCENPETIAIERIFDRFYRSDSARSHVGTGLGLSIARGLTEKMEGIIQGELQGDMFIVKILLKNG